MSVVELLKSKLHEGDIFSDIIGQENIKYQLQSALASGRSIILVGPPGCGKTTFAKNIAKALTKEAFVRVQGSPDLTAEDLLGDIDPIKALEFGPMTEQAFTPGKIFKADKGVLFFDEVNRCPQKIQNALLQVLQEKYATIGSYEVDFPSDFIFIGTMNPEDSSTEKLSSVFADRFDMVYVTYPEKVEEEVAIIDAYGLKFDGITFPRGLLTHMVQFIQQMRTSDKLSRVPSVRATLGLFERAQSNAFLFKQTTVTPKHVYDAILSVLAHRMELKPSMKYAQNIEDFVKEAFEKFATSKGLEVSADSASG
jgi:magnesium chelatase subunit I